MAQHVRRYPGRKYCGEVAFRSLHHLGQFWGVVHYICIYRIYIYNYVIYTYIYIYIHIQTYIIMITSSSIRIPLNTWVSVRFYTLWWLIRVMYQFGAREHVDHCFKTPWLWLRHPRDNLLLCISEPRIPLLCRFVEHIQHTIFLPSFSSEGFS